MPLIEHYGNNALTTEDHTAKQWSENGTYAHFQYKDAIVEITVFWNELIVLYIPQYWSIKRILIKGTAQFLSLYGSLLASILCFPYITHWDHSG